MSCKVGLFQSLSFTHEERSRELCRSNTFTTTWAWVERVGGRTWNTCHCGPASALITTSYGISSFYVFYTRLLVFILRYLYFYSGVRMNLWIVSVQVWEGISLTLSYFSISYDSLYPEQPTPITLQITWHLFTILSTLLSQTFWLILMASRDFNFHRAFLALTDRLGFTQRTI